MPATIESPASIDGEGLPVPSPPPPGVAQIDEQGGLIYQTGAYQYPDGSLSLPDGTTIDADRTLHLGPSATVRTDGRVELKDGTVISPTEGIVQLFDGTVVFIRPPSETWPSAAFSPDAATFMTIAPPVPAIPAQTVPLGSGDPQSWNTIATIPVTIANGGTP